MVLNKTKIALLLPLLLTPFLVLSQEVNFTSSNLPIVVINTHGGVIVDDPKIPADMGIIYNGPGVRNFLTDSASDFNGKIGIEIRGSSSAMFDKKQYGIEVQDEAGEGIDAPLLGMPKKDDWILYAAYDDKTLIRDALAYRLGRDQGRYASRSRYCEVVINGYYLGIYILLEKVKRDKNRVNIAKLDPDETTGEDLTGGYIIKIDKTTGSGGGAGWYSTFPTFGSTQGQRILFQYEYPKPEDIANDQEHYIQNFVYQFETALFGNKFNDPVEGYDKYADRASFVDFLIMNEMTKNPDGYRLSTFFYKQKDSDGGKMFMGPIWDFNEGFGNVDYCTQGNPEGFAFKFNAICPEDGWQIPFWWERLLQDPRFQKALSDRWTELRNGPFEESKMLGYVDSVSSVLSVEARQRNFQQWNIINHYVWPNYYVEESYPDGVNWLKDWITSRLIWLDANIAGITSGLEESKPSIGVSVYPNPFAQEIKIDYFLTDGGMLYVELFDLLGRQIDHVEKNNEHAGQYQVSLNTYSLPVGTYVVKMRYGNQVHIEKVIKQN